MKKKDAHKLYLYDQFIKSEIWTVIQEDLKEQETKKRVEHNYMSRGGHTAASAHCAGFLEALEFVMKLPQRVIDDHKPSVLDEATGKVADRFKTVHSRIVDSIKEFSDF